MSTALVQRLSALAGAADRELDALLAWWTDKAVDHLHGGFHGEIDALDRPIAGASKGIVLNARILWFFSSAAATRPAALPYAKRAYDYIRTFFVDRAHGGVFWELDAAGSLLNGKKQAYAQAFAIYALIAYHRTTRDSEALHLAHALFALMQQHLVDAEHGGYLEARDRAWSALADVRLSEFDANHPKTMNTHLHVLEAYTALHAVAPTPETEAALRVSIDHLVNRFWNPASRHLRLFFTLDWHDRSEAVSFGHDIEASWLLWEAGKALGDPRVEQGLARIVIGLAHGTLQDGVGPLGAICNERKLDGQFDGARVWWAQAEAMVGFLNAFELSEDVSFLRAAENVWSFILAHHIDRERGEWTWWSDLDTPATDRSYKAGFWKGPYHNGRALLEVSQRARRLIARHQ
ncbi:MAG TPA: AGE family epimerase/isomerase [Caulobacterales bacterium]|nr:AGE family epimerase/isomerase [Caulobacterales bacterium]